MSLISLQVKKDYLPLQIINKPLLIIQNPCLILPLKKRYFLFFYPYTIVITSPFDKEIFFVLSKQRKRKNIKENYERDRNNSKAKFVFGRYFNDIKINHCTMILIVFSNHQNKTTN